MISCLLFSTPKNGASHRFYRIEICANLFNEYSLVREWGFVGRNGSQKIDLFGNLREAASAADTLLRRNSRKGYRAEKMVSQNSRSEFT
ncbi:WGR domain-containing protein [Cochlodiniinecator piscidefendens]|uniref:WGR domain-containing protein n=1 Tax=Cochlodiniinecator piscidefendens TaxID=2715756 RepID=UPI00140AFA86|nr:WGR domain-containing protein [Cochlodiniinecator piscidefendens]